MARPRLAPGIRRVLLPRVRDYQREFHESPARFKLAMNGRRWGKNKVALLAACAGHGPSDGGKWRRWRGALSGGRVCWIVPDEKGQAAREAWRDVLAALGSAAAAVSHEAHALVLPGGGSVQLLSAYEPDRLRSFFADGCVLDECSLLDAGVWTTLRPVLSDYQGWAMLLGNVPLDVVNHWFARLYHLAQTPAMRARGWEAWRRPGWENPQLTGGDLDEARETMGARAFLREYGAELVGAEGGVWREEWFRCYDGAPVVADVKLAVVTLDAAWKTGVRNDASSCQVWAKTVTGYYLLDELHGRWESPELRRRVVAFRGRWAAELEGLALPLYVEDAGGGGVALQEFEQAVDFPVLRWPPRELARLRTSSKMARNEAVSPLAEAGKVWLPSPRVAPWITAWVQELVGFPDLPHDDRCDAAAMALHVLQHSVEAARAILAPRPVRSPALIEPGGYR